jgi:allantoin racemase
MATSAPTPTPARYRIWFQGATGRDHHSPYISKLEHHLAEMLGPEVEFSFNGTHPPATTTHAVTEFRMARHFMKNVIEAEKQGYDAVAITHFQDAGLAECKSLVDIPVLGLGETTLNFSLSLGRKLGLITINPIFIPWHEDQINRYGLQQRVVGVRAVDAKVSDFMEAFASPQGYQALYPKFEREVNALLALGADVIVPAGGLPMLLYGGVHGASMGGAPIVNGLAVIAKQAIAAIDLRRQCGLGVSRRSNFAKPSQITIDEFIRHG